MNSPEPKLLRDRVTAFTMPGRPRTPGAPERAGPHLPRDGARTLNGFSIARLYSNFQFRREEHFPEGLSDAAFELLIDLYQYDWLNRWAGAPQETGMSLARDEAADSAAALVEANLIAMECGLETVPVIRLTPSGRVRLSTFFDAMAGYISTI